MKHSNMFDKTAMIEELRRYYTLWRESNAVYEDWAKAHGLSLNSLLVLYSFHEEDGACTQKQISRKWLIPKQTVHAILKDFEEKGFIVLVPEAADRRNKQIHLTEEGRQFVNRTMGELREKELYVMEQIGAERMKCMNDELAAFIELFGREGAEKNG